MSKFSHNDNLPLMHQGNDNTSTFSSKTAELKMHFFLTFSNQKPKEPNLYKVSWKYLKGFQRYWVYMISNSQFFKWE